MHLAQIVFLPSTHHFHRGTTLPTDPPQKTGFRFGCLPLHVRFFLYPFYSATYLLLYTVLEMAPIGLDKLALELIEFLVKNAFDMNKGQMERGYDVPATIKFHISSEKHAQLQRFQVWRDLLNLAATCKYLRRVVAPLVYYHDIKNNYTSSLLISAKRNNLDGIAMALSHGADPHIGDRTTAVSWTFDHIGRKGWKALNLEDQATPLNWAALNGHIEAMELLLEHNNANINHRVRTDTSVARYRSIGCRRRAAKFLQVFPFPDKPVQEVAGYIRHGLWGVDDSICLL